MKIFKVIGINLFISLLVFSPFIFPILLTKRIIELSKTSGSSEIHKGLLNNFSLKLARSLYQKIPLHQIVQFDNDCYEFKDEKLIYWPKKNSKCIQDNIEFYSELDFGNDGNRLNNFGNISDPEIIILGDSIAMGWGVSNEEIFTSKMHQAGFKSINFSVSSYGLARQLIRLREWANLNPRKYNNVETILIQYCGDNDKAENIEYNKNPSNFPEDSKYLVSYYKSKIGEEINYNLSYKSKLEPKFYPIIIRTTYELIINKFTKKLKGFLDKDKESNLSQKNSSHSSEFFLVMDSFSDLLKDKKIILFVANGWGYENSTLTKQFENHINSNPMNNFKSFEIIPNSETRLKSDNDTHYVIDPHPNAYGHELLGRAVVKRLQKNQ